MDNFFIANEIKRAVKLPELLNFYGLKIGRGGRLPCPFHNGKDNNMAIKDDFYHCFVCGASGDAIKFVQDFFELSFRDAAKKINEDFSIGLPFGEKLDRRRKIEIAQRVFQRKRNNEQAEAEYKKVKDDFWQAFDNWSTYDKHLQKYKPTQETNVLHPLFVEALKNINLAEVRLDEAERNLYLYERRNN